MPTSQSYYNETQGLFIELFNRPAATAGYNYFGSELASGANPITVFGQISGSTETTGVTINSIFENLLGRAALTPALTFFGREMAAGQTIANIASQIYTNVLNESPTSQDNMLLTDKIAYANNYTGYISNTGFTYDTAIASSFINLVTPTGVLAGHIPTPNVAAFASTLANATNNTGTGQGVYTLTTSDTGHSFSVSVAQPDTLIIPFGYGSSSLGQAGNNGYFAFQGDASGYNAVDIQYNPTSTTNLPYYLENATNFQILDFNYSQSAYSNLSNSSIDLSQINSGFNTFVLDGTYNTGTFGSYSGYEFTNATNSDTFIVQAATMELSISDGGTGNTANVVMDGVGLGMLYFSPSSAGVSAPTVNIDSVGSTANTIQVMGDSLYVGDNLQGSFTLNVYGPEALNIGSASSLPYSAVSTNDNGIELSDGSTLTIGGCSASSNLTAYIYENSSTITNGVTVNAAGFAGTLTLIETQFNTLSPDTFILGSGTDSVATNNDNASVTVGSGKDTIISNAAYSTDSSSGTGLSSLDTTPGYITTIQGNILAGDSITFGTPSGNIPADYQIYPGTNGGSSGAGVVISSLTSYNESGAASVTAAITAVISTLEIPWDTNNNQTQDSAGWFQYGGNTYIVNSMAGQNQVVELVGTHDLSNATFGSSTATITVH